MEILRFKSLNFKRKKMTLQKYTTKSIGQLEQTPKFENKATEYIDSLKTNLFNQELWH